MQVSLSDTGGLSRRLEVAVPASEVADEVQQRLKRLSRTARLKGFRPGKAPLTVIAKQFGDQVRAEVLSDLVRSSFAQAVSEQKLRPAGGPRIEPIAMGPETDLKYAAHFEVLPEIRVNPPERLAIERPASSVEETDVDAMIENMRAQRPVFTPVDREARDTDRVVFDYKARIGGKPFEGSDLTDVRIVLRGRVRAQLLDALYRDNPIELPRALSEEEVGELQLDPARRLGIRDASRLPPHESFEEPARRRVALGLLMSQIAQSQGLKADRERVAARLAELAEGYPDPEEARRAYLRNPPAMR